MVDGKLNACLVVWFSNKNCPTSTLATHQYHCIIASDRKGVGEAAWPSITDNTILILYYTIVRLYYNAMVYYTILS